jgi:GNAT superfamily N-acetyltransferase
MWSRSTVLLPKAPGKSMSELVVRRFDANSGEDSRAEAALRRNWYLEQWPASTAPPISTFQRRRPRLGYASRASVWLAVRPPHHVIGRASFEPYVTRRDIAHVEVYVLPIARREGVAQALVRELLTVARHRQISTFEIHTSSQVEAGEAALGLATSVPSSVLVHTQMPVGTRTRMDRYAMSNGQSSRQHSQQTPVVISINRNVWPVGRCLLDISSLRRLVALRYDREYGQLSATQAMASTRQYYKSLERNGIECWTILASISGACIGYTEFNWDPEEPDILVHTGMAISEEWRKLEIVYALATAGDRVVAARPIVKYIRRITPASAPERQVPERTSVPGLSMHYESRWHVPTAYLADRVRP